jgi:mycothiol synthase
VADIQEIFEPSSHDLMEAALVCGLEEDHTGRTPVEPTLLTSAAWNLPGHRTFFWRNIQNVVVGFAIVAEVTQTVQLSLIPACSDQANAFLTAIGQQCPVTHMWKRGQRASSTELPGSRARLLLIMSRGLTQDPPSRQAGPLIRPFEPTTDVPQWLVVNADIFADLPDQANVTQPQIRQLLAEPWFDPAGFLLAVDAQDHILGFHWTKLNSAERLANSISGEVFVLGVRAHDRGSEVAALLLESGLARLADRGAQHAHLWVESDNKRAVAFYERHHFRVVDQDELIRLD